MKSQQGESKKQQMPVQDRMMQENKIQENMIQESQPNSGSNEHNSEKELNNRSSGNSTKFKDFLIGIAEKWQKEWEEKKAFEANPDSAKKKFFVNVPYPYINAFPHIGHLYTLLRVDIFARYKRMKGFNVLFPQGWHATGSPIINAALRVKNREEKQIRIMRDMGFDDEQIKKFESPEYWVEFFVPEFRKDWKRMGASVDWRREFFTTSLNKHYDKFIQWQFRTLKKKGYVGKGKHPVVWCTHCNSAVSDHSRVEGEGETPQEFTLLKFELMKCSNGVCSMSRQDEQKEYLIAATLRPETVFGQTNVWLKPDYSYLKAKVTKKQHTAAGSETKADSKEEKDGNQDANKNDLGNKNSEIWIASKEFFEKLKHQEFEVEAIEEIESNKLIGSYAVAPKIGRPIIILPSYFCDPTKGTGIVTSVPSDAPDDYMGLRDLQKDNEIAEKYRLNAEEIKAIKPIPIIDSSDLGDMAAAKICDEMGIKSQFERKKLEKAKKIVYKKGFYEGVMNRNCKEYSGMKVEEAKERIKEELIASGQAERFYELTGYVECRCLTPSVVKIVSDQWFLFYGDKSWKKLAHKCLENMKIYPGKAKKQFSNVIDWLHHWACTREQGLGTRLPWQKEWVIESLSDSTIYMAYYTISHKIREIDPELIDDDFFDYIFLGEENAKPKPSIELCKKLREEFDYWYPFDFRNSGKDLIQNHLTFCIFNHTAIFPEEKWPKGIGVNGWVTVDGQKMSKSLGNMIPLRDMAKLYSPDVSRLTIISGGESLDDCNWDTELAKGLIKKLEKFYHFCVSNSLSTTSDFRKIDGWLLSQLIKAIEETESYMEETMFRTALQCCFFDLLKKLKWYKRRSLGVFNKELAYALMASIVKMLQPFAPHFAEELWSKLGSEESKGSKSFVSLEQWPDISQLKKIAALEKTSYYEAGEGILENLVSDIARVKKLVKFKPKKAVIVIADEWKYKLYEQLKSLKAVSKGAKEVMQKLMQEPEFREHGTELSKLVPKLLKADPVFIGRKSELELLMEAKEFIEKESSIEIEIVEKSEEEKAKTALPGKPAIIFVEA